MGFERKYAMTREENIFLVKRNIVDYIWKSVNLEGIGMTYPDTQAVYNGMAVAGYTIDEINTVNDLKNAWQEVLSSLDEPLTLEYIKLLLIFPVNINMWIYGQLGVPLVRRRYLIYKN